LVEGHNLKGEVRYALEYVFTESKGELALCCPLHLHHFIALNNLTLENVNDAAVLFVDALDISFCLTPNSVFVAFLVGESEWLDEYVLQGKKAFFIKFLRYISSIRLSSAFASCRSRRFSSKRFQACFKMILSEYFWLNAYSKLSRLFCSFLSDTVAYYSSSRN
jgi:hypothetical protein